ncbi:hypothetical protein DFH07DRAFT_1055384 [Mycena maculata]|uniref:Uncharacterized protein n=1 Tax=Mycena maculata TaxID=230809 RepID=A0AAD7KAK7_9AGAR|nr:hypothetical protein DFH07DRAFT_1055384 [Mycena maculata]
MPWHEDSDSDPHGSICHFALGLNEQLESLAGTGVVARYAFSGKTALILIASSAQEYGSYLPHHTEFLSDMGYPTRRPTPSNPNPRMGRINGSRLTCDLELTEPTDSDCAAFEAGLAHIRSALADSKCGYWFHTRKRDTYGRIYPAESTYFFQRSLGMKHVFQVVWNTAMYPPPQTPVQFTYKNEMYYGWSVTTPLNIEDLFESSNPEATAFIEGILTSNASKGKGRA